MQATCGSIPRPFTRTLIGNWGRSACDGSGRSRRLRVTKYDKLAVRYQVHRHRPSEEPHGAVMSFYDAARASWRSVS